MKQATAAGCRADSDGQRGDVGSMHEVGVPETQQGKTRAVITDGDTGVIIRRLTYEQITTNAGRRSTDLRSTRRDKRRPIGHADVARAH